MQPVTASCEVHINTRAVVLTVTALPSPSAVVRLHLDPPTRTAELYTFENADAARPLGRWAALLPTSTDWNAGASLRRESDYASIRLSLVALGPYDSMLLQDRVREASTALPRLQQLNNRLSCRACGGAAIVAGDSFDRALRLPSSSWMELAELWGCHTETFAAAPNRELVIAPRMCYLGDAHLVVHASHVAQARVDSRRRYRCAQCAALLGSATRADGAAMLYFEALTDGRSLFSAWSVERRLARQLFELAQGSGALRFHCASQQLYMVLLNWDTVRHH